MQRKINIIYVKIDSDFTIPLLFATGNSTATVFPVQEKFLSIHVITPGCSSVIVQLNAHICPHASFIEVVTALKKSPTFWDDSDLSCNISILTNILHNNPESNSLSDQPPRSAVLSLSEEASLIISNLQWKYHCVII